MAPQIKNTHGVGLEKGVKLMVYGRAGTGKTTLCASAPAPIIISAEGGMLALHRWQLPYIEVRSLEDLHEVYRWLTKAGEARQFQTVCLDSITEIAEVILAHAKVSAVDVRRAYGDMLDRTLDMLKKFRELEGFHVYVSAKQEQIKGDSGIVMNTPMMPGQKLGPQLPYIFDEVFQAYTEMLIPGQRPAYWLRTQPDMFNDAKDRSGMLDPVEPPDLSHIIRKILGTPLAQVA